MTETNYKECNNIEDLELEFFKELDIKEDYDREKEEYGDDEEIRDNLKDLFGGYSYPNLNLYKIIKIIDRKIIGYNIDNYQGKYIIFDDILDLKVGDMIDVTKIADYNNKRKARIMKIDEKVLNKEFLQASKRNLGGEKINMTTFRFDVLTRKKLKRQIKSVQKRKEIQEKINKIRQEKENKKEEEIQRKWEKENIGIFPRVSVNKNILEIGNDKVILKKNVNKIFQYDFLERGWLHIRDIIDKLVEDKENFTLKNMNDKKIYNIEFEDNPKKNILKSLTDGKDIKDGKDINIVKVNGVRVRKNKIKFILNRINENTTKEQIKLLNKITGMKSDLLELKEILLNKDSIKVDIKCLIVNENKFDVEIFGIKKCLDWVTLKKFFFYNGTSRSLGNYWRIKELMNFAEDFGLTKQDVYGYLKRIVMVNELNKGENKDETK